MHPSLRHVVLLSRRVLEMIGTVLDLRFALGGELAAVVERQDVVVGATAQDEQYGEQEWRCDFHRCISLVRAFDSITPWRPDLQAPAYLRRG